jgi:hypothetical protein
VARRPGVREGCSTSVQTSACMSFPSQTSGPQNKTLHVAGISPVVDELLLAEIFGAFGVVSSCRIVRDAAGVHGYCDFADYHSAR